MKLARTLAAALLAVLMAAFALPSAATASTLPGTENAAAAAVATPTVPKYFGGMGYGPYNIAESNAWSAAYGRAANEGYPAYVCRRHKGPDGIQLTNGSWELIVEIYCEVPPAGVGPIIGVHSGKCMDVKGASLADGAPIQLYSCNGTGAQTWKIEADGTVRALGRCLDVQYAKTENGSLLGLNTCHGAPNQQWEKLPGGLLRSVHSGKCLDALGWRTNDGARLGIWDCTPAYTNQQWYGTGMGS